MQSRLSPIAPAEEARHNLARKALGESPATRRAQGLWQNDDGFAAGNLSRAAGCRPVRTPRGRACSIDATDQPQLAAPNHDRRRQPADSQLEPV